MFPYFFQFSCLLLQFFLLPHKHNISCISINFFLQSFIKCIIYFFLCIFVGCISPCDSPCLSVFQFYLFQLMIVSHLHISLSLCQNDNETIAKMKFPNTNVKTIGRILHAPLLICEKQKSHVYWNYNAIALKS